MSRPRHPHEPAARHRRPNAIASTQSFFAFVKSICDVMRRSNCASALQYVPELAWILFLRILDAQEARDQEEAEAVGAPFAPVLRAPWRWQDWAAPPPKNEAYKVNHAQTPERQPFGRKRQELFAPATASCSTSSTRNCCRTCSAWTWTRDRTWPCPAQVPSSASSAAS